MFEYIISTLLTATIIGVVGWVFNTQAKLSVQQERIEGLKALINQRFDNVSFRLDRIEKSINGFLHS